MPLLLQAITPRLAEPAASAVRGFHGYALARVEAEDLTAWASVVPEELGPLTRADVLEHHRVVGEVFELVNACLPARFPTTLADEAALQALLVAKLTDVRNALARVRGCAELAVTAAWTTAQEEPLTPERASTPGRRYLLERQAALAGSERRFARARALADELEACAGADLVDARRRLCPSSDIALSLALLVRRSAAEHLDARLPRAAEDVRILVNGPWPAYTFADL
jgi:gas vesicle protein GvpL/GvpF